jgi:glycosyltransferase involved in cell wall biosynthesis
MKSLRILITGTTGDSMPPPYAGVQNVSLLYARQWKKMGQHVGISFVYRPDDADDMGAGADYFFEYNSKPTKYKKALFLLKYFLRNPYLYFKLFFTYYTYCPRLSVELILYSAYGVFMNGVIEVFKPDVILSQTALIKTFMVSEIAKQRHIPVVFNTYAEVHDMAMGVNKHLNGEERNKYWTYFLNLSQMVIGMDNCSVGPLMYLPEEKVKVFYDTCDFGLYQVVIPETVDQLRDYFHLPKNLFLVGMMGAFHYRKGHDQLIKAVSILKKRGIYAGAVIVGGNVGLEKWQELAQSEDVVDRIFFFQNFSDAEKTKLYECIDAYANLSNSTRSCGLDLALLEAMSCALPVIVYNNGALPRAVKNNGYLIETGNITALANAIEDMSKLTEAELSSMSEGSRQIASLTDITLTAKIKYDWFVEILNNFQKK